MSDSRPHRAEYGIVEHTHAADEGDAHAERIRLVGYSVVPGGFSPAEIQEFSSRLDAVLARQTAEFGADRMNRIGDALTARCPLVYDDIFLRLVTHPTVLGIARRLLGDYVVLMQQNGIINAPNEPHTQVAYHRDLPYQHFVSSRPLAVSALFCVDPFRAETGATVVLPSSHRVETFPSPDVCQALEISVTAEPGSFIVFDAMLFHRAGSNRSDRPRRGVNQVFSVPIIAQQIALPQALDGRFRDDPALARLLGYEVSPAPSVAAWRERRLARVTDRQKPQ